MRLRLTPVLAASFALLLLAAPSVHAAPTPPAVAPGRAAPPAATAPPAGVTKLLKITPFLQRPSGLAAPTSKPEAGGMAGLDASQISEYVKSLTALKMSAEYHADPNAPATNLGPATLQQGADIKLSASLSKKDGEDSASLDGLEIDASGVKFGPAINLGPIHTGPLLSLQKVTIDSKGAISVKLNSWIPTITINRIEHLANGDTVLHSSNWWVPPVTIKANGDITTTIGLGPFHFTKTLGHMSFNPAPILASWPPKADVAAGGIVAALEGLTAVKAGSPASAMISQLAGTVDWSLSGSAHDPNLKLAGAATDATVNLAVSGEGKLSKGELTSSGDKNKVHVDVSLGGTSADLAKASVALQSAKASLDGTYSLDLPLADAKHMKVDFSGHADVSANGTSAKLTLPNGAHVSVGSFAATDSGDVKFVKDANGISDVSLSNDKYTAQVTGPIHVDGLAGPVKSVDLAGNLSSSGTVSVSQSANSLAIKSNLDGTETTTSDTTITLPDGTKTTLKKGSQVNVALGDLDASVSGDSAHPVVTAGVQGSVGVKANLGDLKVTKNGETIDVASTTVQATLTGQAGLAGGKITGSGDTTVTGHAALGKSDLAINGGKSSSISLGKATLNLPLDGAKIDLASGTVDATVKAHVATDGNGLTGTGSASLQAHENIGDSKVMAGGKTIDLPSGSVDVSANGQLGFNGKGLTTASASGNARAHENVGDLAFGPLDLPASSVDVTAGGQVNLGAKGLGVNGQVLAGTNLTKNGTLDLGAPGSALTADTTIDKGTGLALTGTFNHTAGATTSQINGRVTSNLATGTTINAQTGKLDATLNGSANVAVNAPIAATLGPGNKITIDPTKTSATIATKLGLLAGTKVEYNEPGKVTSFTLENSQSYIAFSTPITLGANGMPSVKEIDNVDVLLVAGPSQVLILGNGFTVPAGNQVHVKGNVVFGPHGLQVTGSATLGLNFGNGTPVSFSISF